EAIPLQGEADQLQDGRFVVHDQNALFHGIHPSDGTRPMLRSRYLLRRRSEPDPEGAPFSRGALHPDPPPLPLHRVPHAAAPQTRPPSGVYFTALSTRLISTCRSRDSLPITHSAGGHWTERSMDRLSARCRKSSAHSAARRLRLTGTSSTSRWGDSSRERSRRS